jgi:hypothetical protein
VPTRRAILVAYIELSPFFCFLVGEGNTAIVVPARNLPEDLVGGSGGEYRSAGLDMFPL